MPHTPNNATVIDSCTRRIHALESYAQPRETILVNGARRTAREVKAVYEACLASRGTLARKRAEVKAAMAVCAKAEEARLENDRALKAWAVHRFGPTSEEAHDFGFPPPRPPTMTTEERSEAVRRAKAPRAARHTMGKVQKEKIRGVLPEDASGAPDEPPAPPPSRST